MMQDNPLERHAERIIGLLNYVLRFTSCVVLAIIISGCKVALINRFELQNDGSVVVHAIERIDDQMYAMGSSQGYPDWGKPVDGWDIKKYVAEDGDHVIDASQHVHSVQDASAAIAGYYKNETSSTSSSASTAVSSLESGWHFDFQEHGGLFTKTYHVHADIPRLIPENTTSSASSDTPEKLGEQMAAGMLASIMTLSTEIKVPGKILSTNGEYLPDGSIRFTHPLTASSQIDLLDETPDSMHIGIAILLGFSILAFVVISQVKKANAGKIYTTTNEVKI